MSLSSDRCPLCGAIWDIHSIRTEKYKEGGQWKVRPIGWDCPPRPKEAVRQASEEG